MEWEMLTGAIELCAIGVMNTRRGLKELFERFGTEPFTGEPLRDVMVGVVGGPSKNKAGWQASLALGRLVTSGVVDVVSRIDDAKAKWGHTYRLNNRALKYLNVPVVDEDEEEHALSRDFDNLLAFLKRLDPNRRVRVSPEFINDPSNRSMLRLGVAGKWLDMTLAMTPLGVEWVEGETDAE